MLHYSEEEEEEEEEEKGSRSERRRRRRERAEGAHPLGDPAIIHRAHYRVQTHTPSLDLSSYFLGRCK